MTKFRISENKWFISAYILKGSFPLPDGMSSYFLENHVKEMNDSVKLDMYFYADDYPLPLQLGDKVVMGNFDWKIVDKVYDFNKNTLIFELNRF